MKWNWIIVVRLFSIALHWEWEPQNINYFIGDESEFNTKKKKKQNFVENVKFVFWGQTTDGSRVVKTFDKTFCHKDDMWMIQM